MENKYPLNWNKEKVKNLIAHYENQTDEEAIAEDEAAYEDKNFTLIEIPNKLIPKVRKLLIKTG